MWVALLLAGGCTDYSAPPRYFESSEDLGDVQHQELLRSMTDLNSIDGAVDLVRSAIHPEHPDALSMEEWVQLQRAGITGDVMFPKWDGRRLGSHRFEVRYTHTVIDYDYNIGKSGYSWEADTLVKLVTGPFPLAPAELDQQLRRTPTTSDGTTADSELDFSLE